MLLHFATLKHKYAATLSGLRRLIECVGFSIRLFLNSKCSLNRFRVCRHRRIRLEEFNLKLNSMVHKRLIQYAYLDVERGMGDFDDGQGCSSVQVDARRELFGENTLNGANTDTFFYRLRRAFVNPFTTILFILALISFVTDVILAENIAKNATTVVIILTMLLISGALRLAQEMKAKKTIENLKHMVSSTVSVKRDGDWIELPSSEIVVGDRIRLAAGERVPADLRVLTSKNLFVSQSVITGESAFFEKTETKLLQKAESFSAYTNLLFSGSSITSGECEAIVLAVGKDTVYGSIHFDEQTRKNGFDRGANSIAWVLIRFMAILVPVVFIASGLTKGDWFCAIIFALSVAVGLTPELLPMVITACLARGSAIMGKKQTIVKNINAMQCLGSMDILCVDKTGTLTGDVVILEYYMDILGNENIQVLEYAVLNSLFCTGMQNHLNQAILKAMDLPDIKKAVDKYIKLDELPFDYERKFSSVLVHDGEQRLLLVKGSIEDVCKRCTYAEYKHERHKMDFASVHAIVDEMLEDGMKMLAVAYKKVHSDTVCVGDEHDLILLGFLAFFDAPKKSAANTIQKLKDLNINIRVLTGDQKNVAISICRRLGIDSHNVMTGIELAQYDENMLPIALEKVAIFAELSPKQKAQVVNVLESNGHVVGFLGDGMNDLPAIVEADVGISVDTAAETVKESADVILLKKDLAVLDEGVLEGRKAFSNMSKYIRITASSNFGNIFSIVIASALIPFFPMTSIQLLLLNLLYDSLCLVLPWDHVDVEALRKPVSWSGKTLGRFMRCFGTISSLFDLATFAFLFFVLCPYLCGGYFNELNLQDQERFIVLFQTGWFLESMWTQVLILHLLRSEKLPLLQSRPSLPVMCVTILGIVLFTALIFTPVGGVIGLTSLPVSYFAFLIFAVALYLLLVTIVKWLYVRKYHELV